MNRNRSAKRWAKLAAWLALPVVVIALAVTRPGYPVDAVDMTDSSVWITNLSTEQRKVARFNQPIEELTGGFAISPEEGPFDVAQSGSNVAVGQARNFRVVDPVALRLGEPTPYPQEEAEDPGFLRSALGASSALVMNADATEAWVRPFGLIEGLDSKASLTPLNIDLFSTLFVRMSCSPLITN
jgi:hypothetical protein